MAKHGLGYAWQLEDGWICNWAETTKEKLTEQRPKPSSYAKIVPVMIIKRPSKKYRGVLIKAIQRSQRTEA